MSTNQNEHSAEEKTSAELNENELNDVSGGIRIHKNSVPKPKPGRSGGSRPHEGKGGTTAKPSVNGGPAPDKGGPGTPDHNLMNGNR